MHVVVSRPRASASFLLPFTSPTSPTPLFTLNDEVAIAIYYYCCKNNNNSKSSNNAIRMCYMNRRPICRSRFASSDQNLMAANYHSAIIALQPTPPPPSSHFSAATHKLQFHRKYMLCLVSREEYHCCTMQLSLDLFPLQFPFQAKL